MLKVPDLHFPLFSGFYYIKAGKPCVLSPVAQFRLTWPHLQSMFHFTALKSLVPISSTHPSKVKLCFWSHQDTFFLDLLSFQLRLDCTPSKLLTFCAIWFSTLHSISRNHTCIPTPRSGLQFTSRLSYHSTFSAVFCAPRLHLHSQIHYGYFFLT